MTEQEKNKTSESPPHFEISAEDEHKLTVWAALECIEDGDMTKKQAMAAYKVTAKDLAKYKPERDKLLEEDDDE